MQMLKVRKCGVQQFYKPLSRYKRAGLTDMHTDLRVPEIKRVDPKDKDAVEM